MDRLTHERCNGIKSGYWSAAKKEDLVQRLAEYENIGLSPEDFRQLISERSYLIGALARQDEELCDSCANRKPVDAVCEDNGCDCYGCTADCICTRCNDGDKWRRRGWTI